MPEFTGNPLSKKAPTYWRDGLQILGGLFLAEDVAYLMLQDRTLQYDTCNRELAKWHE